MSKPHPPKTTPPPLFWHCYGNVAEELGAFRILTIGPTNLGPDDVNPAQDKIMRDIEFDGATWITYFDHQPSNVETDQIQPEEYQQYFPDGTERPWS